MYKEFAPNKLNINSFQKNRFFEFLYETKVWLGMSQSKGNLGMYLNNFAKLSSARHISGVTVILMKVQ